jgi:Na+-transporting methylmalonyl-CoA/oxaloacetate decarboxylase gamma subunit
MTRPRRALRIFLFLSALVLTLAAASACSGPNPFQAAKEAAANSTVPTANTTSGTGLANNNFLPDKNLSNCVNTNEQPNCGSAAKGTKGMYFTFVALVLGLGFVMWRISLSVRARDAVVNAEPASDAEPVEQPTDETSAS